MVVRVLIFMSLIILAGCSSGLESSPSIEPPDDKLQTYEIEVVVTDNSGQQASDKIVVTKEQLEQMQLQYSVR